MNVVKDNHWILLIYNTVIAIVFMFVLSVATGEFSKAMSVNFLGNLRFWALMTFAGLSGFLINIAFFLQIKYTSALTNTISGTAKACLQTILALFIFKNDIEPVSMFGLVLSIVGFGLYSNFKRLEMEQKNQKKDLILDEEPSEKSKN